PRAVAKPTSSSPPKLIDRAFHVELASAYTIAETGIGIQDWKMKLGRAAPPQGRNLESYQLLNQGDGPRPVLGILGQHPPYQVGQGARQGVHMIADGTWRLGLMAVQRFQDRAWRIGKLARQHLVERRSQAIDVAAGIVPRVRTAQLRRQIIDGAEDVPGLEQ